MPDTIVPITDLASTGLIEDTPSVSLPPNAFSDCQNVRFHSGAIRKFPDESDVLDTIGPANIVYVAHWPSTVGSKYVVLTDDGTDTVITVYNDDGTQFQIEGSNYTDTRTGITGGEWQHTIFNGGYHIILNNGNSTPVYLQADTIDAIELPGWDSYAAQEAVIDFEFDGNADGDVNVPVTLSAGITIRITCYPRNASLAIRSDELTVNDDTDGFDTDGTLAGIGTADNVTATGFRFVPGSTNGGNRYVITTVTAPIARVTAGVVRAYRNLLVAGNLVEHTGSGDDEEVARTMTGTIRTSDVAGPGQIPTNWNPFNIGVNTADEFLLASTGTIQDMVELQGVLYIYTDSSIHAIQQIVSPTTPFQITPVTENFGADNIDSVIEVDGKHIVVGSDDVYIFAGHPGSISSISDKRVRNNFRENKGWKIARLHSWDELWFWRNDSRFIYIWNYRSNVWTKRDEGTGREPVAIDSVQNDLLVAFNSASTSSDVIVNVNNSTTTFRNSYVERRRLAMTPEFDTETVISMALLVDGGSTITVTAAGTNAPGDLTTTLDDLGRFTIADDYKHDVRVQGRFFNYRLFHDTGDDMNLSGIQLDIGKGGQR